MISRIFGEPCLATI